jgi:hypothetical protein
LSSDAVTLRRQAERNLHMLRNVPARQLLRRIELRLRERFAIGSYGKLARLPAPALGAPLPQPLFAPRAQQARPLQTGFRLTMPWGARNFAVPVNWQRSLPGPLEGSWINRLHYMEFIEALPTPLFEDVVLDWIAQNPLSTSAALRVAWHPFATSTRAVVWMQQIARRQDQLSRRFLATVPPSLAAQLRFIERHFESDLRGNHLVKNIKALLWGAAFFAGAESERWRRVGCRLLAAELAEQVLPDGTHYERSPVYHCQVMADLLECHAVLPAGPEKEELGEVLGRMARAAVLLTHPDGDVAQFNDCALRNAYSSRECIEVLSRVAAVDMPPDGPFALPDAGFFGDRRGEDYLIVDCGAVAPDYLIGHGHGDILSFDWSLAGHRIIVDQGTYQNAAGQRRDVSRSTASHNTVTIDGQEQCDFYGAHRCGRRARAELLDWQPLPDGFILTGSHDGFVHLPGAPRHVRRFEATPGRLVIEDRLVGAVPRTAQATYLLHSDCRVEVNGEQARISSGPMIVTLTAPATLRLEEAEWFPDLYVARPTRRLRLDLPWKGDGVRTVFLRQDH